MRFAVDAHAIGRHLTGNEVYVRSLLNAFGGQNADCEFVAYISADAARAFIPKRIATRLISANPFLRLGLDLPMKVREHKIAAVLPVTEDPAELPSMQTVEDRYIQRVLKAVGGNKTLAAKILGFDRRTLYRKLARQNGASATNGSREIARA